MSFIKRNLKAISLIVGTIVGGGIFGLPYAIEKSGFVLGTSIMIAISGISTLILLLLGEVALRTKKVLQVVGLAEKYVGKKAKWIMLFIQLVTIYGALLSYLIGIGRAANAITGINEKVASTLFFVIAAPIIYFGIKAIEKSNSFLTVLKIAFIIAISIVLLPKINVKNLQKIDYKNILFPYGIMMFAFMGYSCIPNLERMMEKNKKEMKKVIIVSMAIITLIYLLFSIAFVGVYGENVKDIATASIKGKLSIFANILTIITLSTPFLLLGWALKDIFIFDYNLPKPIPWLLAVFPPFIFYLISNTTFVTALNVSGAIAGSLSYFLIAAIVLKSEKVREEKPPYVIKNKKVILAMILIFSTIGFIYTLLSLF